MSNATELTPGKKLRKAHKEFLASINKYQEEANKYIALYNTDKIPDQYDLRRFINETVPGISENISNPELDDTHKEFWSDYIKEEKAVLDKAHNALKTLNEEKEKSTPAANPKKNKQRLEDKGDNTHKRPALSHSTTSPRTIIDNADGFINNYRQRLEKIQPRRDFIIKNLLPNRSTYIELNEALRQTKEAAASSSTKPYVDPYAETQMIDYSTDDDPIEESPNKWEEIAETPPSTTDEVSAPAVTPPPMADAPGSPIFDDTIDDAYLQALTANRRFALREPEDMGVWERMINAPDTDFRFQNFIQIMFDNRRRRLNQDEEEIVKRKISARFLAEMQEFKDEINNRRENHGTLLSKFAESRYLEAHIVWSYNNDPAVVGDLYSLITPEGLTDNYAIRKVFVEKANIIFMRGQSYAAYYAYKFVEKFENHVRAVFNGTNTINKITTLILAYSAYISLDNCFLTDSFIHYLNRYFIDEIGVHMIDILKLIQVNLRRFRELINDSTRLLELIQTAVYTFSAAENENMPNVRPDIIVYLSEKVIKITQPNGGLVENMNFFFATAVLYASNFFLKVSNNDTNPQSGKVYFDKFVEYITDNTVEIDSLPESISDELFSVAFKHIIPETLQQLLDKNRRSYLTELSHLSPDTDFSNII